jgi:hypothetical protein
VHLVEAKGFAVVADLQALAALNLPDRVKNTGVGLGGGRAAEDEQGDQGNRAHGRRGMKEPSTVTSPMR